MKKIVALLVIIVTVHFTAFAQQTVVQDKLAIANSEFKTELVSKFKFSAEATDKINGIENEFFAAMAGINATDVPVAEKEKKTHAAHVTRRTKLLEIPLTGRQMEDIIELSQTIRNKHKL